jgi:hypothetical protein
MIIGKHLSIDLAHGLFHLRRIQPHGHLLPLTFSPQVSNKSACETFPPAAVNFLQMAGSVCPQRLNIARSPLGAAPDWKSRSPLSRSILRELQGSFSNASGSRRACP